MSSVGNGRRKVNVASIDELIANHQNMSQGEILVAWDQLNPFYE